MAGRGPAPKTQRTRSPKPTRGEWKPSPDGGWQHALPKPPAGLSPESVRVWRGWFTAWWAGHWTLDDVPQLRLVIRLHDGVARGDIKQLPELRRWLELYGITPGGQQARRWARPEPPRPPDKLDPFLSPYRDLRVSADDEDT